MIDKILESDRLIFKPFYMLSESEKKIVGDSWANPFNARYNAMKEPYKSVSKIVECSEPTFTNLQNYWDTMYFRVALSKESGELVATCRFGKFYKSKTIDCWDFGFNVILKHWCKGYGSEIVEMIVNNAQKERVKAIRGGADIENYGSYKAMIRNGFEYVGKDEDGDYEYILDLTKEKPLTKEQIEVNWQDHIERTKEDLGEAKFSRLNDINCKIREMVKRIQQGEDERVLMEKYFYELNDIEKFKFS